MKYRCMNLQRLLSLCFFVLCVSACGQRESSREDLLERFEHQRTHATDEAMLWNGANDLLIEGSIIKPTLKSGSTYLIGAGHGDVTGPASEKMMMGYVSPKQKTAGIQTRLWSRAFVVSDLKTQHRVAIVTADLCQIFQAVKQKVVQNLQSRYGDLYSDDNVLLASTHTHSGPGGYSHYALYNFSALGFSQQNFDIIVSGITQSIVAAHESMRPGTISASVGRLENANINRSLAAYMNNPKHERDSYQANTNELMTLIRFDGSDGSPIGLLNWFAAHATSSERDGTMITGDNKGYAAYAFEKMMGRDYAANSGFVAAFANAEAGDASPNTEEDLDGDGDWDCTANKNLDCVVDAGGKQLAKSRELYEQAKTGLQGPVEYVHTFVDMSRVVVEHEYTKSGRQKTCYAAIGLSMLAGAPEDGPGIGSEGKTCENLSRFITGLLCKPDEDRACHGAKPIVLATGKKSPVPATPEVLPLQIVRIGQLALAALPAEFTTMSGRRVRAALQQELSSRGVEQVLLAGYANAYAGYVATPEEYDLQYYEGASTHFGPWTLPAYVQEMTRLAGRLGEPAVSSFVLPRDLTGLQKTIQKMSAFDRTGTGRSFGQTLLDAKSDYTPGQTLEVRFVGASLNRKITPGKPMMMIERKMADDQWKAVAYDWDIETDLKWVSLGSDRSDVVVVWRIPPETELGVYRVKYQGVSRDQNGVEREFSGLSREFLVNQL
jgi:neutral ceramidase